MRNGRVIAPARFPFIEVAISERRRVRCAILLRHVNTADEVVAAVFPPVVDSVRPIATTTRLQVRHPGNFDTRRKFRNLDERDVVSFCDNAEQCDNSGRSRGRVTKPITIVVATRAAF